MSRFDIAIERERKKTGYLRHHPAEVMLLGSSFALEAPFDEVHFVSPSFPVSVVPLRRGFNLLYGNFQLFNALRQFFAQFIHILR
jgi:hypothetical protein